MPRRAVTLIELLVVIGIIGVLLALALPAIQKVRGTADKMRCAANLNQLGLALHLYHNDHRKFPPGVSLPKPTEPLPRATFLLRLLPYLEKGDVWREATTAYGVDPYPFHNPPHTPFAKPIAAFQCPSDNRVNKAHPTHNNRTVALTSYLGVCGTNGTARDGVLFADSAIGMEAIYDGPSHTLIVGERPPSPDFWFGWWYASVGQANTGTPDTLLGAREVNLGGTYTYWCPPGPATFQPGRLGNQCDVFHFWSLHPGGAHFLMAGGSVHFLRYSADPLLPALATRHGRERVELE